MSCGRALPWTNYKRLTGLARSKSDRGTLSEDEKHITGWQAFVDWSVYPRRSRGGRYPARQGIGRRVYRSLIMSKSRKTIYVYGKQPVSEAIESNWPVFDILVRGRGNDWHKDPVLVEARNRGIKVSVMEPRDFDSRFPKASQGIAAKVGDVVFRVGTARSRSPWPASSVCRPDGIQDPSEPGFYLQGFPCHGSSRPCGSQKKDRPFWGRCFQGFGGALFYLPVSEVPNIHWFAMGKKHGIWVCGLRTAETSVWETDLTVPIALIVGSEGRGLSRLVRERCDYLARIPMLGKIDSLNAAVACGMALMKYRDRGTPAD